MPKHESINQEKLMEKSGYRKIHTSRTKQHTTPKIGRERDQTHSQKSPQQNEPTLHRLLLIVHAKTRVDKSEKKQQKSQVKEKFIPREPNNTRPPKFEGSGIRSIPVNPPKETHQLPSVLENHPQLHPPNRPRTQHERFFVVTTVKKTSELLGNRWPV